MKKEEIKNLSLDDLYAQLDEAQARYNKLVLTHKVSPLQNPMEIRILRKEIARIQTEITNKQ